MMALSRADAQDAFRPQDFQTRAVFDLVVTRSAVLKPGASRLVAVSAFATLAHGLMPGNSEGLEILFLTTPITEAARADLLQHDARELRRGDYATLVLFLDRDRRVWQVNASYVTRGTTVARTIAWRPEELSQFAQYTFDGSRVRLKSNGRYADVGLGEEQLTLTWVVDLRLPVFDRPKK
jgi:hypothetical protein